MRLMDYKFSPDIDRERWLESFRITSGLRYFGGKAVIGRYLMNHIFNMACRMVDNGDNPDFFIDSFAGGGKIGISIPAGWFGKVVINDLNYGVASFHKCCKDHPTELVKMIERIGENYGESLYFLFLFNRSNMNPRGLEGALDDALSEKINNTDTEIKEEEKEFYKNYKEIISNNPVNEIVAAAATYWITQTTWSGQTDPYKSGSYSRDSQDNKDGKLSNTAERERNERIVRFAQKHIFEVHKIMQRNDIVIENLDYRELIKKYNGKTYHDILWISKDKYEEYLNHCIEQVKNALQCTETTEALKILEDLSALVSLNGKEYKKYYLFSKYDDFAKLVEESKKANGIDSKKLGEILKHLQNIADNKQLIEKERSAYNKQFEHTEIELQQKNKLWYFDPPYHPATLCQSEMAPYEDTFSDDMVQEMTKILLNKCKDTYGELFYFIKSDYDPAYCLLDFQKQKEIAEEKLKKIQAGKDGEAKKDYQSRIRRLEKQVEECEKHEHDFDKLNDGKEYFKVEVGTFSKNTSADENGELGKGTEFIWYRNYRK